MMAARAMTMIAVVLAAAAFTVVSAETHHVVGGDGGWGPSLDVGSWLSGRVFRVGDKILFKKAGTEEDTVVELLGEEEFQSCNLTNPIRMYTEKESHVALEEEGVRYFASGNMESCKNGLKFPVPVQPPSKYEPPSKYDPPSKYEPPEPEPLFPPPVHSPPPPPLPSAAGYLNGGGAPAVILAAGLLVWYVGVGM